MELSKQILKRTIKSQKIFHFPSGTCDYQNTEISMNINNQTTNKEIQINNNVCTIQNDKMVKFTQILFNNRSVIIQDVYHFHSFAPFDSKMKQKSSLPSTSSQNDLQGNGQSQQKDNTVQKKKLIFHKKTEGEKKERFSKRNTKNIAKNFCNAFGNYLNENGNPETIKVMKEMNSTKKYNNKTIEKIIKKKQLKQLFHQFLTNRASSWIRSSKILDKQIHHQAIELYLRLFEVNNQHYSDPDVSQHSHEEQRLFNSESSNNFEEDEVQQ